MYLFYTAMCVWYELRCLRNKEREAEAAPESVKLAFRTTPEPGGAPQQAGAVQAAAATAPGQPQGPRAPKERFVEWDLIKAVMLFFVVLLHTGRNGWLRGGLSNDDQVFFLLLAPFPMPAFAFISGVFGASIGRTALQKTLCFTFGTFILAKLMGGMIILATPGPTAHEDARSVGFHVFWYVGALVFWYLKALAVWRFTLTPLFHFSNKRNVPHLATFLFVFVLCYALRHLGLPHWTHEWIFFAPYYAQGLLLSPSRWSELLANRRCTCVAVAFLVAWCASLALWPATRDWNDAACARGFLQCPNSHWPAAMRFDRRPLSARSFFNDVRIYASQDALSMAVMWLVAACAPPLQARVPRLAAVCFGIGTRTLYGYVLHFLFFLHFGVRMGVVFPPMESWQWCLISIPLAGQALFVFCSSFTERLFSWAIMPFWMLHLCGVPLKA